MNTFRQAFREYFFFLTVESTTPRIIYFNGRFLCTLYYSDNTLRKLNCEIIL